MAEYNLYSTPSMTHVMGTKREKLTRTDTWYITLLCLVSKTARLLYNQS